MASIKLDGRRLTEDELDALVEAIEEKDGKPAPKRFKREGSFKLPTTRIDRTRLVDVLTGKENEVER